MGQTGGRGLGRRGFLAGAAGAALAWRPVFRLAAADAAPGALPRAPLWLPDGLDSYLQAYENWSGEIAFDGLWTCAPTAAEQLPKLADWARAGGWRLRVRGASHGFSPLTVSPADGADRTLLVDLTAHLHGVTILGGDPPLVRVATGTTMEALLTAMGDAGLGFTHVPAVGDITVGGALAIGAHGSAVPTAGEDPAGGSGFGSLSSLVTSLTAVCWDARAGRHGLRTFGPGGPEAAALRTALGRTVLTEVTLRAAPDRRLRCVSTMDVPMAELMAPPGAGAARTMAGALERTGRLEVIWFPFTERAWLKTWEHAPTKPPRSREVRRPYNYPFADAIPEPLSDLASSLLTGNGAATPIYCQAAAAASEAGLLATLGRDLWGWSRNVLLYAKPTTMRYAVNGYAVHVARPDVQWVVSEFFARYSAMLAEAAARGEHPMNGPVEIRVTGLDGAGTAALSPLRPDPAHPARDTAVWLDALTFPGTPGATRFYRELEDWLFATFRGPRATVRVEWSKGWAYGDGGAGTNEQRMATDIPASFPAGGWDAATAALDALDPHRVFANPFLDRLL